MKIAIIGAGGQARIVYEILKYYSSVMKVVCFADSYQHKPDDKLFGLPVIEGISNPNKLLELADGAIIAIGDNGWRTKFFKLFKSIGMPMVNAIHPTAHIANPDNIGCGVTVVMGAMINTGALIGDNVIVNTGASVDHDDIIGNHVHISPGAILAGAVTVGEGTWIGLGSVIKENVKVGAHSIIGAGSVVLEDVPDNVMVAGIPAKIKRNNG